MPRFRAIPTPAGGGGLTDTQAGLVGAAIAVTAWGGGTVLAKGISMGGLAIAVYRFWLFAAVLFVFMRARGHRLGWYVLRRSFLGGMALGLDVALFFSAVKLTNVVNATVIGSLQPILVGVVAARFFGEHIRPRDAAWSLVALAGVILVVTASAGTPEWSARGDLLAVGALIAWSAYFVASKESKAHLTPLEFTLGTAVWTALLNTPLALAFGQDLSWPSARDWGLLVLMVVFAGIIGHALMNWSLVRIPLWVGSTFTLLIPVASAVLAWAFLGEAVTAAQAGAMAIVLVSLAVVVRDQARAREPAGPPAVATEAAPEVTPP